MPHPNSFINPVLSDLSTSYKNGDMIADEVSPIITVDSKSSTYYAYLRKDAQSVRDDLVGPSSKANEVDYEQATATYTVQDRALVGYISQDEMDLAPDALDPKQDRTDNIMERLLLGREIRVATLLQTNANYASTNVIAAGTLWSNTSTGTPLANIQAARATLAPGMGGNGNNELLLVLVFEAFQALQKHPDLRGGGAESSVLAAEEIAKRLNVDRIIVTEATKQTANEGQTAAYSRVWDKTKAELIRRPRGNVIRKKAGLFSATFRYKPDGMQEVQVREWEDPERGVRGSVAVQPSFSDDELIIQNDMGAIITGILS